jgi:hypothetical protein
LRSFLRRPQIRAHQEGERNKQQPKHLPWWAHPLPDPDILGIFPLETVEDDFGAKVFSSLFPGPRSRLINDENILNTQLKELVKFVGVYFLPGFIDFFLFAVFFGEDGSSQIGIQDLVPGFLGVGDFHLFGFIEMADDLIPSGEP